MHFVSNLDYTEASEDILPVQERNAGALLEQEV